MESGIWEGTDRGKTGKWEDGVEQIKVSNGKWSLERNRQKKIYSKRSLNGNRHRSKTWKVEPGGEQTEVKHGKYSLKGNRQK